MGWQTSILSEDQRHLNMTRIFYADPGPMLQTMPETVMLGTEPNLCWRWLLPLLPLPFFHCFPLCFCSTKKEQKEIKIEQVHAAAGERIDFRHRGAPPPPPPPPPPTAPRGVPTPLGFLAVLAVDPYRLLFLFKPSRTTLSHHLLIAGT